MGEERVQLNTISYFDYGDIHPRALLYALSLIVKVLVNRTGEITEMDKQQIMEAFWQLVPDIEGSDPDTQALPPPGLSEHAYPFMEAFFEDILNPRK